ncbi:MAG: uridine kinaselike protein [Bacillales bacterium]|nr:uridine kinaselike protein [Bacillales bacterium]
MEDTLSALIKIIKQVPINGRYILGIDGLGRAGKTTIVKEISNKLTDKPFFIFHIDDHIVERKFRYNTSLAEWEEYYFLQWKVGWLAENFFQKLKDSSSNFDLPYYDKATDQISIKSIELPTNCLIIIEGVFLQRKEWRDFFDYVVYMDCPRKERFQREDELTQLNLNKLEKRYWKAEEYYLQTEKPMERANFIISG